MKGLRVRLLQKVQKKVPPPPFQMDRYINLLSNIVRRMNERIPTCINPASTTIGFCFSSPQVASTLYTNMEIYKY